MKRFIEIDLLRGLAILGMIIFHVFYILDFYQIVSNEMYKGWFLILVRTVQISFIGLVGVSLALSSIRNRLKKRSIRSFRLRHLKRGVILIGLGYGITLVTFLVLPNLFVRFGILHLIGLGVIFFSLIAHKKYLNLILGIGLLIVMPFLKNSLIYSGPFRYLWYLLGLTGWGKGTTLDYFPVLPWFAVIGFGVFFGHLVYEQYPKRHSTIESFETKFTALSNTIFKIPSTILFMGRHSLIIYLIHIPIILTLLVFCNILTLYIIFTSG